MRLALILHIIACILFTASCVMAFMMGNMFAGGCFLVAAICQACCAGLRASDL